MRFFANTEGGHIETSSQYTTPYVPLATSGFSGLLDDSVNNLQALADAVDGLAMGGSGTAGRVAQFNAAHVLTNSNLIGPAVNVLTLEATGAYTLTVPATGTTALLGTANLYTLQQTIQTAGTDDHPIFNTLAPNLGTGAGLAPWSIYWYHGKSITDFNCLALEYGHNGDGWETNFFRMLIKGAPGSMCVNGYGNTGFGTSYPTSRLHAELATATTGYNTVLEATGSNLTDGGVLLIRHGKNAAGYNCAYMGFTLVGSGSTSNYWSVGFADVYPIFNVVATNKVGIGTIAPTAKLQVTGTADVQQFIVKAFSTQTANLMEWRKSDDSIIAIISPLGGAVFNETGDAAADFRVESDSYDAVFVDSSENSIVIMSNSAGKAGFFGATAIVQPGAAVDLGTVLSNLGLRAAGTAYPITTSGAVTLDTNTVYVDVTNHKVGIGSLMAAGGVSYYKHNINGTSLWLGTDSTSESPIFKIAPSYIDNTHSDYTSRVTFTIIDSSSEYDVLTFDAVGEAKIGFLGHAAAAQQIGCAEPNDLPSAITAIKALRTALNAYGLTTVV